MTEARPQIVRAGPEHLPAWRALRAALWPATRPSMHAAETAALLAAGDQVAFVADLGGPLAFAEASLRRESVHGCSSSPVVYLEGIYVRPAWRLHGVARALCAAIADWGRARGCREFVSDVLLDNLDSQAMHSALDFHETDRVVYFRRQLT